MEAVILAEVHLCSAGVSGFALVENDGLMVRQLDLLEEYRESVTIRLVEYQQKLARHYDRDVRKREFSAGDLVLHRVVGNTCDVNAGKLAWEGSYRIIAIAGAGEYYLEDLDERPLPRPWNFHNLKKFYH